MVTPNNRRRIMRMLAAAAVLATLVVSPALAQSSDPDLGSGNIVRRNDTALQTNGVPGRAASPVYLSTTPFDSAAGGGNGGNHQNAGREKALRECSSLSRRYTDTGWGAMGTHQHRSCMIQHGQME